MFQKFFKVLFAESGDKAAVPDALVPAGNVSFDQGYTYDYERDLSYDPDALPVEREQMNYLFYAITQALQQYQTFGTPEFITTADNGGSPYSYSKGARVRYTGDGGVTWTIYESLEDSNTDTPPSSKWQKKSQWSISLTATGGYFWHESGFILQCGYQNSISPVSARTFNLPVAVDVHVGGIATPLATAPSFTTNYIVVSGTQARVYNGSGGSRDVFWQSIGYKAM